MVRLIPPVLFFLKIILAILVPLPFYINFRIIFSTSTKTLDGRDFVRNCMKLSINLGRIDVLRIDILSLPIHELVCFSLFYRSPLISLISILCFQHGSITHVLLDLYLSILFFWVIINGVFFQCSHVIASV